MPALVNGTVTLVIRQEVEGGPLSAHCAYQSKNGLVTAWKNGAPAFTTTDLTSATALLTKLRPRLEAREV